MTLKGWILLALLYAGAVGCGHSQGGFPLFCPTYAILFVALAKTPWRNWPLILVGALFMEMLTTSTLQEYEPVLRTFGSAFSHAVGACGGAILWKLGSPEPDQELSLVGFLKVLMAGVVLGSTLSSVLGTLGPFTLTPITESLLSLRLWWLSDALAIVTIGTLGFWLWPSTTQARLTTADAAVVAACSSLALLLFSSPRVLAQPFLLYPPLIWLALRYGPVVTNLALTITTLVATYYTLNSLGPFSYLHSVGASFTETQLFCLTLALSTLPISLNARDSARARGHRDRVQDELGQTEARYQTLFTHAATPILVLGSNRVEKANAAAQKLFGFEDSQQPTLRELSFPDPDSDQDMEENWPEAFRDGAVLPWTARDGAGEKLELELHISHVKLPHGTKVQVVIRDNTAQFALREELDQERQNLRVKVSQATSVLEATHRELDQLNTERQRFLTTISHELKTPLTTVLGKAETLKEELWGPLTEEQKSALGRITESGAYLDELVSDLLDLAKVEAADVPVAPSNHNLLKVCRSSLRLVRAMAKKHEITIIDDKLSDLDIYLDARFLKQILVNLLTNAIKFTPAGGQVGMEVIPSEEDFELVVWDTGPGISEEIQGKLFRPFVREDESVPGFGLGLVLVQRLTDSMGGNVSFETVLEEGTRFRVRLPYRCAAPALAASTETVSILILEPEEGRLTATAEYFRKRGHRVRLTHNEVEFLSLFAHWRPQLVLTEMDRASRNRASCLVTLETLKETLPQSSLVVLTQGCSPDCESKLLESGASRVIHLPIPLPDLERFCLQL